MEKVSVIIVNYKTPKLVVDCIDSIKKYCSRHSFEIIVVDNHSEDDSVDIISKCHKDIILLENKTNGGFGKANNLGVSYATGKYVLLLNSDTVVFADIIDIFVQSYLYISSKTKVGCIGIHLLNEEGRNSHSFGFFPKSFGVANKSLYQDDIFKPVHVVIGADMFLEKSLFDSFNGFDENIFLYEEELELQYRFFCAGFQNYYVDKVGINHLEGKSSSSFFKRKCSFISNCYIYNLHFSKFKYYKFRASYSCRAFLGIFKSKSIRMVKEKIKFFILTISYFLENGKPSYR